MRTVSARGEWDYRVRDPALTSVALVYLPGPPVVRGYWAPGWRGLLIVPRGQRYDVLAWGAPELPARRRIVSGCPSIVLAALCARTTRIGLDRQLQPARINRALRLLVATYLGQVPDGLRAADELSALLGGLP